MINKSKWDAIRAKRETADRRLSQNLFDIISSTFIYYNKCRRLNRFSGFKIINEKKNLLHELSSHISCAFATRAACELIRAINDLFDNRYQTTIPPTAIRST